MGPKPMQLVVVMAVRKAVSAATITFTATSMTLFFIRRKIIHHPSSFIHLPSLVLIQAIVTVVAAADRTRVDHEARSLSGHREVTGVDTIVLRQFDA